jgi:hypothetical protein
MVTMLLRTQIPLSQHAATLHQPRVSRIPYLVVAQVLGKSEPETEPEQLIEKPWLTKAKHPNLSNLLKTQGLV